MKNILKNILVAVAIILITFFPCISNADTMIDVSDGGHDLYVTPCDADPYDLDSYFIANPIPYDFFGPGSDLFNDTVNWGGLPLGTFGIYNTGPADTIIERKYAFDLLITDKVQIEIVALSLVSCDPIEVVFPGPTYTDWDVHVELSTSGSQGLGSMTVSHEIIGGGTFMSSFPVQPIFTFTNVSDTSQVTVLDPHLEGWLPTTVTRSGLWVHDHNPEFGTQFVDGLTGPNFYPMSNPIPEPSTTIIFLIGLFGMGLGWWRKRRKL